MKFPNIIRDLFPKRAADTHKGTYGTLLTVCGSYGMAGAAMLCAKAALRSGVGLVACATPRSAYEVIGGALPEAVFLPLSEIDGKLSHNAPVELRPWLKKADALVLGCGLGRSESVTQAVSVLLAETAIPVVLDADGINAAAQHMMERETVTPPLVLTPHPAEMGRLLGCSVAEVQQDRAAAATEAARRYRAVAVLKGHRTVVADQSGVVYVNETGNPGMATAGSGDVLAGMIGGFLAQGMTPRDAAIAGVYLHGAAGDEAAARLSQQSLMASDLIDALPALFLRLEQ